MPGHLQVMTARTSAWVIPRALAMQSTLLRAERCQMFSAVAMTSRLRSRLSEAEAAGVSSAVVSDPLSLADEQAPNNSATRTAETGGPTERCLMPASIRGVDGRHDVLDHAGRSDVGPGSVR